MGSSLCNEFVSEVYTIPMSQGLCLGSLWVLKGQGNFFLAINVNIKVSEVLLK